MTTIACRERIDIDLGSTYARLVVDGKFSNDTATHWVILSKTTDYYEPSTDGIYISDASVSIEDDSGKIFHLRESPTMKGYYATEADAYGIQGRRYTLRVRNVDVNQDGEIEDYSASEIMPFIAERIDSVKGVYGSGLPPFFNRKPGLGWNILLYAEDPSSKEYYIFILSVNEIYYNNNIRNYLQLPDDFTQGSYIRGVPLFFIPDNDKNPAQSGDTIRLLARSITSKYNQYISDVKDVLGTSIPLFGGVSTNVRGNIDNGAIGYFSVYSSRKGGTILRTNIQN